MKMDAAAGESMQPGGMMRLATVGDNCVDIYPQLGKAFSGGNAVNVAVYSRRYAMQSACVSWVGDDAYGALLKRDLLQRWAKMAVSPGMVSSSGVCRPNR